MGPSSVPPSGSYPSLRPVSLPLPLLCRALPIRMLHADREPVPDVAAIYFVEPKQDNIDRIAKASKCPAPARRADMPPVN